MKRMSEIWGKRTTGSGAKGTGPGRNEAQASAKIFGVMAVTSLLTFATLTTGYQLLFSHSVFA